MGQGVDDDCGIGSGKLANHASTCLPNGGRIYTEIAVVMMETRIGTRILFIIIWRRSSDSLSK